VNLKIPASLTVFYNWSSIRLLSLRDSFSNPTLCIRCVIVTMPTGASEMKNLFNFLQRLPYDPYISNGQLQLKEQTDATS